MLRAFVFAFYFNLVLGFSPGPPAEESTCLLMRPSTDSPHLFSPGNGSYDLVVSEVENITDGYFNLEASVVYTCTISSSDGEDIKGYLVQAVNPAGDRIGSFGTSNGQRHLKCSGVNSAIADSATLVHNKSNSGEVSFTWTAPDDAGLVDFRYTIVKNKTTYFGPLSASASNGTILTIPITAKASDGMILTTVETKTNPPSSTNQSVRTNGTETPFNGYIINFYVMTALAVPTIFILLSTYYMLMCTCGLL